MSPRRTFIRVVIWLCFWSAPLLAETLSREQWGAPLVAVSHAKGGWTIAGKKNTVMMDEANLAIGVQAGSASWKMTPSAPKDMLVKYGGREFYVRLADAKEQEIVPYDTGFKTGVKIRLAQWP